MREQKTLKGFSFNREKFFFTIIGFIFLTFTVQVFGNTGSSNPAPEIICVGPTDVGDNASEAGNNPCNLHASIADRDVPVRQHMVQIVETDVSSEEAGESAQPKPKKGSAQGIQ